VITEMYVYRTVAQGNCTKVLTQNHGKHPQQQFPWFILNSRNKLKAIYSSVN